MHIALLFSFFFAAPASARDWGNVGGWHVTAGTNSCGMYTDDRGGLINVGGTEIVFLRRTDGADYLQITNLGWSLPRLDENQIFFEIDGARYTGLSNIGALPAYPARGFLAAFDDGFDAAMRRGSTLDIGLNAAKIAQISLRGSTAALTTLDQCVAELRAVGGINNGAAAVPVPVPVSADASAAESPGFTSLANAPPKPIGSPASWVEDSDYPRDFDARAAIGRRHHAVQIDRGNIGPRNRLHRHPKQRLSHFGQGNLPRDDAQCPFRPRRRRIGQCGGGQL